MIYICTVNKDNDAILNGMCNINTIEGLYNSLSKEDMTKLIITEEFILKYFTSSGIVQFISDTRRLLPHLEIEAPKYDHIITEDVDYLANLTSVEDLIDYVLNNREQALKLINHVFSKYNKMERESIEISHKINSLCSELLEANDEYKQLSAKNVEAENTINLLKTQLDTLITRINYSYNKNISSDTILGTKVDTLKYNHILYFKEHIRVHYIDTFIYYLKNIMTILHDIPVRFVVMEPLNAYGRAYLYPTCKSGRLTYDDIDRNDIFLAGYSPKVMERVLANPSHVEALVILDRTGWEGQYVEGNNVHLFHIVPDIETLKIKPADDIVFSYSNNTQHIPYIEGYDSMTEEQRLAKYSSMESMKYMVKLLGGM